MAQVLKEELRLRIIKSAKKELLEKGYRDASMRQIAASAHMTVGNLYRYFKSKDDLITMIVSPAVEKLNAIIQEKTEDRISLYRSAESIGFSQSDIVAILDSLAEELIDVYSQYHDEMRILMLHSEVHLKMEIWFTQLIQVFAKERFFVSKESLDSVVLLSRMMAVSIFNGLQECFRLAESPEADQCDLKKIIQVYFRCYVSMLNADESFLKGDGL